MLELQHVAGGYGETRVLFDVSLSVRAGEVVALLGRNGMGKTTTIRTIMGLLPRQGGTIRVDGADITGLPPFRIARMGLGLVPEGRQIFPTLNVAENLIATARPGPWTPEAVFDLFPRLRERRLHLGHQLSGGEQQMLAIGRALATNPRLLILDEATEGLAPLIRAEIWACLARLKAAGLAILLIDKTLHAMMQLADRHVILDKGVTVWTGSSAELAVAPERERYLHLPLAV
jgi:branched-chain amino acid transport system ATP-binding protein